MTESAGMPLVSIILATYNSATHLAEAIESILHQTYPHFELVVVDDGSTDGTAAVLASFHDPRIIRLRHPVNAGVARANNTGFLASRGAFIGFIGSDDTWEPEKLATQMTCFSQLSAEYGVVYTDMWEIDPTGNRRYWYSPEITNAQIVNPHTADYQVYCLGNGTALFRRACMERIGLFDEQFRCFVDLDFFIRATQLYRFYHLKQPLYVYRSSRGISSNPVDVCLARLLLLQKHPETAQNREFLVKQGELIRPHLQLLQERLGAYSPIDSATLQKLASTARNASTTTGSR
jgi:glycosyltransferase involved in cell wall biosynthesis